MSGFSVVVYEKHGGRIVARHVYPAGSGARGTIQLLLHVHDYVQHGGNHYELLVPMV